MPADPPTGYLTRPDASKKYNRSQRALERDLDSALSRQDEEQLVHWKLVTKDGQVRDGGAVTLDMVKDFVTGGMTPAWCVAQSYLAKNYGLKGSPKPGKTTRNHPATTSPPPPKSSATAGTAEDEHDPLLNHVDFLKERIRALEKEKQQEIERHDKTVSRLFEQLAVKDKQISAWDDVTQNITKGLATGQLQPRLTATATQQNKPRREEPKEPEPEKSSKVIEVEIKKKKRRKQVVAEPPKKKAAAIWPQTVKTKNGESRQSFSVSLQRSYRGDDGKPVYTNTLWRSDVLPAALALLKSYDFINDATKPAASDKGE